MIKLITATAFSTAIELDSQNKIINTSKNFKNFIGQPFYVLEHAIRKNKFLSLTIEEVEESNG
jgi:hypothetical protein